METKNEKDAPEKAPDKKESWKIIKLRKPVSHMGMQIESLDLTGLDDMTLDDMARIYSIYDEMGGTSHGKMDIDPEVMQEVTLLFAKLTAQHLTGLPLEVLGNLSARDAIVLKNRVYRFFYMSV